MIKWLKIFSLSFILITAQSYASTPKKSPRTGGLALELAKAGCEPSPKLRPSPRLNPFVGQPAKSDRASFNAAPKQPRSGRMSGRSTGTPLLPPLHEDQPSAPPELVLTGAAGVAESAPESVPVSRTVQIHQVSQKWQQNQVAPENAHVIQVPAPLRLTSSAGDSPIGVMPLDTPQSVSQIDASMGALTQANANAHANPATDAVQAVEQPSLKLAVVVHSPTAWDFDQNALDERMKRREEEIELKKKQEEENKLKLEAQKINAQRKAVRDKKRADEKKINDERERWIQRSFNHMDEQVRFKVEEITQELLGESPADKPKLVDVELPWKRPWLSRANKADFVQLQALTYEKIKPQLLQIVVSYWPKDGSQDNKKQHDATVRSYFSKGFKAVTNDPLATAFVELRMAVEKRWQPSTFDKIKYYLGCCYCCCRK